MLILITINIIILFLDSPWVNPQSTLANIIKWSNFVLNIIFILEELLKIISDDFIWHSKYEISAIKQSLSLTSKITASSTLNMLEQESMLIDNTNVSYNATDDNHSVNGVNNMNIEKEQYIHNIT